VKTPAPDRRLPSRAGIPRAHERHGVTRRTRIPTPDARREYHCRRTRNDGKGDAVYTNLAYVPVCNCMPVCKSGCRNPLWMWTKKS